MRSASVVVVTSGADKAVVVDFADNISTGGNKAGRAVVFGCSFDSSRIPVEDVCREYVHAGQSNDLVVIRFRQNKLDGFVVDDVHAAFYAVYTDVTVVAVFMNGVVSTELDVCGGDWSAVRPVCIVANVNLVGLAVFGDFQAVCQVVIQTAGGVLDKEFVVQWTGHGSVVVRTAGVWSQGVRHIADCDGEGILLFAAGRCSSFGVFFLLLFCFFFGCLGGRLRICILCRCIAGAASCNRQRHGCCQQQCQNSFLHRCFPPFSTSPTDSSWNQPCCNLFALCRCFINYYTRTIGFAQFLNSV